MPTRSKTKALRRENETLRTKGTELAAAVHALCGEGSDADAPYWHRASEAATEFEGNLSTQPDQSKPSSREPSSASEVTVTQAFNFGYFIGKGGLPEPGTVVLTLKRESAEALLRSHGHDTEHTCAKAELNRQLRALADQPSENEGKP